MAVTMLVFRAAVCQADVAEHDPFGRRVGTQSSAKRQDRRSALRAHEAMLRVSPGPVAAYPASRRLRAIRVPPRMRTIQATSAAVATH